MDPMMMNPMMADPMQGTNKKVTNLTNFKIVKCKNFEQEGTCKYGNTCTFAHGETELRTKVENSMLNQTSSTMNPQFMFNPYMMDPNMLMQMQYGMNMPMDMSGQQQGFGMDGTGFNLNPKIQFQNDPNFMYYQNYPNQNN
jgi:hypothetical protein